MIMNFRQNSSYLHQSNEKEKTVGIASELFEQETRHERHDAVFRRVDMVGAELVGLRTVDEDNSDVWVSLKPAIHCVHLSLSNQVVAILWIIWSRRQTQISWRTIKRKWIKFLMV